MTEGWLNFDYVILFSENERYARTLKYKVADYLPGFTLIGIYDWNFFLLTDNAGKLYSLPCLPLDISALKEFSLPDNVTLEADHRYTGTIRWYLKPEIAGGNTRDGKNLVWVSLDLHADLVVWWNNKLAKKHVYHESDFENYPQLLKVAC